MPKLDQLIAAWDEAHRELAISLEGLPDNDLWRRPQHSLLSVGEIVGHIVNCEARRVTGDFDNEPKINGPLIDFAFAYYSQAVEQPVTLNIGVAELAEEVARVHREARAALIGLDPAASDPLPADPRNTWLDYVQYMVFHVAYHTGQIYSARHLLGHATTDN